jgi:TRAP-type C4-dicarboxylate transport system substrate-binding protein
VTAEYFEQVGIGLWDQQNEAAMNGAIKENGMEIITLSPEEADRWITLVEPVQQDFVSRMNKQGLNGQEILDKVKALADKYNQQFE